MSEGQKLKMEIDAFVQRTLSIRKLSSPDIREAGCADDYSTLLKENFISIGDIAAENRSMLDRYIMPVLSSDELLSDEVMEALNDFLSFLLNPWPEEELDLTLLFALSRRLLDDALKKENDDLIIRQCGRHIYACYNNMDRVNRLRVSMELTEHYLQDGLYAANILLEYLDHEKYLSLSQESRESVLSYSRFYIALYDTWYTTDELKYLYRSGRVSRTGMIVGTALSICPILNLDKEGHLLVQEKVRGLKKTVRRIHEIVGERVLDAGSQTAYICHSDIPEQAREFGEGLKEEFGFGEMLYTNIGPTIGSNCGPGLMAVFFWGRDRDMKGYRNEQD